VSVLVLSSSFKLSWVLHTMKCFWLISHVAMKVVIGVSETVCVCIVREVDFINFDFDLKYFLMV